MKTRVVGFWLAVLLLTVALRAPALFVEVLDPDEAGHAVGTFVWMDGGTLYRDYVDNKQPLVYVTYASAFALFGRSLIAVHALTIPWLLLTAFLICLVARRLWGSDRAGRVAALVFTLSSSAYLEKDMLASNTEILMNLPLVAAFWVVFPRSGGRRYLVSALGGILLGIAALYNLKALIALPILVAAPLFGEGDRRRLLRSAATLVATAVPVAAVVLWFAAKGGLGDLVYWNILLNRKYSAAGVPLWFVDLRRGIVYGFPRLLLFLAATSALWFAALRSSWDLAKNRVSLSSAPPWFAIWLLLSFLPVVMGGRLYGHYFIQLLPPLAIMASGWIASRLDALGMRSLRVWVYASLCVLPVAVFTVAGYRRVSQNKLDSQQPQMEAATSYVRQHTQPEDRIFIWGYQAQAYYYAERRPASRFVFPQTLSGYVPGNPKSLDPNGDTSDYIVPAHWDRLFEDLERHPAEVIMDVAPAAIHFWEKYPIEKYPRLKSLLEQHYVREVVVDGIVVYRRKK